MKSQIGRLGRWEIIKGCQHRAMTLIELLCVIAIIAILAAMYLGVIAKAFIHVKRALGK